MDKLSAVREGGRKLPADRAHDVPPASRERGDDPFGLWEAQQPRRKRGKTWLTLGIVTGVIGFAVAAFVLTGSELVFGGSVAGPRNTTIFGGGSRTTETTTVQTVTSPGATPTVTQTVPVAPPDQQTTQTVTQTVPAVPPQGAAPQQEQVPTTPQTVPTTPAP